MLNPVFSLCVYFVEMSISYIFFSNILEQRFRLAKCLIIGCGVFFIASAVNLVFNNNSTINGIVTYIAAFVFALVCFRAKIQQYFFYCAILVVSNTAFEITTIFMSSYVTGSGFRDYNNDLILLLFETITSKSLFFLFVLLMLKVIRPKGSYAKLPTSFFLYPVTATFCQIIFWHVCCQPKVFTVKPVTSWCLECSHIVIFSGLTQKLCFSKMPANLPPIWISSPSKYTISLSKAFLYVENVISSAYRVYTHPVLFAKRISALSRGTQIIFVIIGDDGAPCGSFPFRQAICAIVVAASSPMEYGGFINIPRTRPK